MQIKKNCIYTNAKFHFEIFIKATDYNLKKKKKHEINPYNFFLSQLIPSLSLPYMDVHIEMYISIGQIQNMIGIKSTSTEMKISHTGTQWNMLV